MRDMKLEHLLMRYAGLPSKLMGKGEFSKTYSISNKQYICELRLFGIDELTDRLGAFYSYGQISIVLKSATTGKFLHVIKLVKSGALEVETGKPFLFISVPIVRDVFKYEDSHEVNALCRIESDFKGLTSVIRSKAQYNNLRLLLLGFMGMLFKQYDF